jgi:hypothetical protein
MFVKPKTGRQVPDPEKGGYLLPEGREVEKTQYWLRRVADEDVVETDPPVEETAPVKAKGKGGEQ